MGLKPNPSSLLNPKYPGSSF